MQPGLLTRTAKPKLRRRDAACRVSSWPVRCQQDFSGRQASTMKMAGPLLFVSLLLISSGVAMNATKDAAKDEYLLFVGTYTGKESKGIYAFRFDTTSARLAPLGLVAETPNPSFLAVDPRGRFLYAVNELEKYQGESSGSISAFAIDQKSGRLSLV
ncbi:MAG: hypothetical protein DMG61_22475 [Acidobacteria bacterium]|nr:MAG: hypothetical protein DMG61_22475 [Acidobacteriota bacterium]